MSARSLLEKKRQKLLLFDRDFFTFSSTFLERELCTVYLTLSRRDEHFIDLKRRYNGYSVYFINIVRLEINSFEDKNIITSKRWTLNDVLKITELSLKCQFHDTDRRVSSKKLLFSLFVSNFSILLFYVNDMKNQT